MRHEVKISPPVLARLRSIWKAAVNYLRIAYRDKDVINRIVARGAAKAKLDEYFDQVEQVMKQNPVDGVDPKPKLRK